MIRMLKRAWARAGRREVGVALVAVIGIGAVLTLLVTTAIGVSLSTVVKAKGDQDWSGAMAAAYAGVDDYKSRVADNYSYVQYGNPDAPFSASSNAAGSVTLPTGSQENPAFGIGATGGWASVSGSDGTASYRYEVDNSQYSATGQLRLRSTGRVGDSTRSIVVNLKQKGFIDFLYFTNYEVQDPAITGMDGRDWRHPNCAVYERDNRSSKCEQIQFASGDEIDGPVHSNDTLLIACGAKFAGSVETSNTSSPLYDTAGSWNCGVPKPAVVYKPVIGMPATNASMIDETRTDIPARVPRPGCLYTGPTSIVFHNNGTMTVRSPWTKVTRVVGNPATGLGTPPAGSSSCGTPGNPSKSLAQNAGTLAGVSGQSGIPIPDQNLIFVQNVPRDASQYPLDPNLWASRSHPAGLTCTGADGSTTGNGIGYPIDNEDVPTASSGTDAYGCYNGDAFVHGVLGQAGSTKNGALTISAANYIYATGDITYANPADILGLVAKNAVWVWNPMVRTCSRWGGCSSPSPALGKDRTIDAAILSVSHTFQVQNYDTGGDRGTLTVDGSIAQNFRGPVGTSSGRGVATGYLKEYTYDKRLRNIAPPKFLSPVSTSYGVSQLIEVAAAFKADGSVG